MLFFERTRGYSPTLSVIHLCLVTGTPVRWKNGWETGGGEEEKETGKKGNPVGSPCPPTTLIK